MEQFNKQVYIVNIVFYLKVELIINGIKQELMIIKERFEGPVGDYCMDRSIAGHNPYNLFILTIVYSKNLPTSLSC